MKRILKEKNIICIYITVTKCPIDEEKKYKPATHTKDETSLTAAAAAAVAHVTHRVQRGAKCKHNAITAKDI